MNQTSNIIYYRFKSEKRKYPLLFLQPYLTVSELRKLIIKNRNLDQFPETFQLVITNEKSNECLEETVKILPNESLIIDRIPWYKLKNYKLHDLFFDNTSHPSEIYKEDLHKTKNNFYELTSAKPDPLLKIINKLSFKDIKTQFCCKLCGKLDGDPVLTACCGETSCETCIKKKVINDELMCPFSCNVKLKYFPNIKEKELREKLRYLLSDRIIKENNKILKNSIINSNVACGEIITNNMNSRTNCSFNFNQSTNVSPTSTYSRNNIVNTTAVLSSSSQIYPSQKNYEITGNTQLISPKSDLTISQQNPHFKLFEKSRFFIIKSSNRDNINTSKIHNEWATTIANQKKLNDAFSQKDVVLIFSVNKSGFFQGYAVMTSFISDKVSSLWNNDYSVKLGGTFNIQWLTECEMPFNFVKNLTNPLNNYEPVVKSRDTQEIPKEIGIQICHLCYEIDSSNTKKELMDSTKINHLMENNKRLRESRNPSLIAFKNQTPMMIQNRPTLQLTPNGIFLLIKGPQFYNSMQMYIYQQHHYPFPYDVYRNQMPMIDYFHHNQMNNSLKKSRERSRENNSRSNVNKKCTRSNSSNSSSSSDSYNNND